MEFGPYQLQIFVSLVVVLGAAFVALICDFLKGNNEQLRELTVELRVRREEEQRRFQMLAPQTVPASVPEAPEKSTERRIEGRAARSMATPKEPRRAIAPEALAAMERGAQLAGAPKARATAASTPDGRVESRSEPTPVVETAAPKMEVTVSKPTGKTDWNSLLARRARKSDEVIEIHPNGAPVPAGFHDGFILSKLVQKRQPVSGLVVSIGVNAQRETNGSLPQAVKEMIQSLIGAGDFACQSNEEEFLLIYPNEHGASAQRRLSQIAQQLWDFQLRSMGEFSILFSWGGVEVSSETIDEAIASANERMQETRRGRKLLTMIPRAEAAFKQAV